MKDKLLRERLRASVDKTDTPTFEVASMEVKTTSTRRCSECERELPSHDTGALCASCRASTPGAYSRVRGVE